MAPVLTYRIPSLFRLFCAGVLALVSARLVTAAADAGSTFVDHGVAAPVSSQRGVVATVDGQGRNVVLSWLMDHRGGYALLIVDAETGRSEQVPMPFPLKGDCAYSSLLSSKNKLYTHFGNHFVEFDVAKRAFTFSHAATPTFAMGMTEDDAGVIWAVIYPQSGVVSFNPETREFRDYGEVHKENWAQYQRFVAADDAGWIYFALGMTATQIVALDPATGKATPMLSDPERRKGMAYLYRDLNGRVYGQALRGPKEEWFEFHKGSRRTIGTTHAVNAKPIITGDQGLFAAQFPDGSRIKGLDLIERRLNLQKADGTAAAIPFDYSSEGAELMGVITSPHGTITGGSFFPFRFFEFDPHTDEWTRTATWYQWNTVATQSGRLFVGGYPEGFLLEWNPRKPWVKTVKDSRETNPAYLARFTPAIHRPHRLFAHPDGRTIVMGGSPQYGDTGGGLLFWDRVTRTPVLLTDQQVVPDQSTMSLAALPDGNLLGGTTTEPGTGGEKKATEAVLYLMNHATRKVEWSGAVLPKTQAYQDLCVTTAGTVIGIADRRIYFGFDPREKKVLWSRDVSGAFGMSAANQGPRIFVQAPDGEIYVVFQKGVARVDPVTLDLTLVANSPVPIRNGGAYLDGRVYFTEGSHLCSLRVKGAGR